MSETQADNLNKKFMVCNHCSIKTNIFKEKMAISFIQLCSNAKVLFVIRGKPDTLINTKSTET